MGIMNKIKNVFSKNNNNNESLDDGKLYSTVVYNTREHIIFLISYGADDFTSISEFIIGCYESGIRVILGHDAIEEATTPEDNDDFDIKPVVITHNRYYALISGKPTKFNNIFKVINLDNTILNAIIPDIYNYCTSPDFDDMIDYGILNEDDFKYKRIAAPYDERILINSFTVTGYIDDIKLILSKCPVCFKAIDIAPIIYIYINSNYTAVSLIAKVYSGDKTAMDIFKAVKNSLYSYILKDCSIENLEILIKPLFLRSEYDEFEDPIVADMRPDELDSLFQQQYDRFESPTADYAEYESIDEVLKDNEENENMREADKLDAY